jgi:CxxC motif-containing protein (DUF1111 family)
MFARTTLVEMPSGPVETPSGGDEEGPDLVARGKELFLREWLADDPRSHGGDGLGPVFNDSSCVACHNLGGPGGGGPVGKNVDILTASSTRSERVAALARTLGAEGKPEAGARKGRRGEEVTAEEIRAARAEIEEMAKVHAGFRTAASVVLHRFGLDPGYETWRTTLARRLPVDQGIGMSQRGFAMMMVAADSNSCSTGDRTGDELGRIRAEVRAIQQQASVRLRSRAPGRFDVVRSQRSPTPLFGAGLIDAIPDAAIRSASERRYADFPEVQGRVSLQEGGKVGRFGWKAQMPSLEGFVLTACAVELGLEVPGHRQGGLPQKPEYRAPGLDMDRGECDALVAYVRGLPAPRSERPTLAGEEARYLDTGRELFMNIGCASCHTPRLAAVDGLYSDLLLHDMGEDLGDTGSYGHFVPPSPGLQRPKSSDEIAQPANRREWRTPPLWGVRDSAPYMHDGRAETLEQAIALHGGQGESSARRYFGRTARERLQVQAFLKSLAAPDQVARVEQ